MEGTNGKQWSLNLLVWLCVNIVKPSRFGQLGKQTQNGHWWVCPFVNVSLRLPPLVLSLSAMLMPVQKQDALEVWLEGDMNTNTLQ